MFSELDSNASSENDSRAVQNEHRSTIITITLDPITFCECLCFLPTCSLKLIPKWFRINTDWQASPLCLFPSHWLNLSRLIQNDLNWIPIDKHHHCVRFHCTANFCSPNWNLRRFTTNAPSKVDSQVVRNLNRSTSITTALDLMTFFECLCQQIMFGEIAINALSKIDSKAIQNDNRSTSRTTALDSITLLNVCVNSLSWEKLWPTRRPKLIAKWFRRNYRSTSTINALGPITLFECLCQQFMFDELVTNDASKVHFQVVKIEYRSRLHWIEIHHTLRISVPTVYIDELQRVVQNWFPSDSE